MWLSIDNPDGIERRYSAKYSRGEPVKQISLTIYSKEDECFFPYRFYLEPDDVPESPDDTDLATESNGARSKQRRFTRNSHRHLDVLDQSGCSDLNLPGSKSR
jgi:hypothetical protein